MTASRPDSRLGTDLGPYRVERVLGRGGMGVVYLAEQRELGRKVALKLLPDELAHDADFQARFERESRLAASIDHPNIIPLYEAGEIEGTAFLAMRYVDGVDLASRLADGPLDPTEAVGILAQVAGALDAAHARGLVHRDVKPGNVLLDQTAQGAHAYLTDFGLTKQAGTESGLTRLGSFMGTPAYMAPEQIEGQDVDGRADQYSLACMTFELLTGSVPFQRDQEFAVAMAHVKDQPPSAIALRHELPAGVDLVLARGMAKDRGSRYSSCVAFVTDLRRALAGVTIAAPFAPAQPTSRRRPLAIAAILGLGLIAVTGLALVWGLGGSGSPSPSESGSVALTASSSSPSPDPTPAPAPTSTAFPTAQEAAFIATLPPSLTDCRRVKETEAGTQAGINQRVEMSNGQIMLTVSDDAPTRVRLRCVPPPGSGADEAFVFWDPRTAGSSGINSPSNPEWGPDTLLGWIAGNFKIPDGDCANVTPANGRWESAGSVRGRLVCRVSESSGKAWIYWTDDETRVFGWAGAPDGDGAGVYEWWSTTAPFIIPPEDL